MSSKILIVSESPVAATGLAEALRLIFCTILDTFPNEYELHQVALFHSDSAVAAPKWAIYPTLRKTDSNGNTLFQIGDALGEITFRELLPKVQPDLVFGFNDANKVLHLCSSPEQRQHKVVLYINFDGFPFIPRVGPALNLADAVVVKSDISRRVALACLPEIDPVKVHYMYSPADIVRFRPSSEAERMETRRASFPDWMPKDAFVIGWVGRNQWRKQVWLLYEAIQYLRTGNYMVCRVCGRVSLCQSQACWNSAGSNNRQHSGASALGGGRCRHCCSIKVDFARPLSDVFLWLHMPEEPLRQDWERSWLENHFEVKPGKDIHYTDENRPDSFMRPAEMAELYKMWDCLLYLSGGEGFGIPAWEAMSSALPVVYTNYSSHAEFLGRAHAGLAVGGVLQPEPGTCILRMIADVSQVIEAVRHFYFDRAKAKTMGRSGRDFCQAFSPEVQAEWWHRLFQRLLLSTYD